MVKRRHLVVGLALIAALAVAVPVFALTNSVSPPTKKVIRKEVAKQIAKAIGPQGPTGATGAGGAPGQPGPTGTPDPSNFYDKAASDARFVQNSPSGTFQSGVFSNHVVLPNTGTYTTVLSLPEGFIVSCASNDASDSRTKVENASPWAGNVQYTVPPAALTSAGVSNSVGGIAVFGASAAGTARYDVMNTAGATAPTRVWTIDVTVLRSIMASGGPHCFATAVGGPA